MFSGKSQEADATSAAQMQRKPIRATAFMLVVSQYPIDRRAQASCLGLKPVSGRCCVTCWGAELDAAEACTRSVLSVLARGLQQIAWLLCAYLRYEVLVSLPEHGS